MARLIAGALVAAVTSLAACGGGDAAEPPAPSEAEARRVLLGYVEQAASAPDAGTFCAGARMPRTCVMQWETIGGKRAVPSALPAVLASRVEPPNVRVLVLCGVDGLGRTYAGDFPVSPVAPGVEWPRAALPVFWFGGSYHSDAGGPALAAPGGTSTTRC